MVREQIHRNPLWKQKIMSRELNILTQLRSCLIRDVQHIECTTTQRDTSLLLALKEIRRIRAEHLHWWHTRKGHENNLFTDEKIFTIKEQYNHQKNKISVQTSHEVKENVLRVQVGHHFSFIMVWWEVSHQGMTHLNFCKKGVKLVSECIKRTCYKELWNILTWPSSVVRNGSFSRTQFLPKRPFQLMCGCGETFWPSSALRIGLRGVQTSHPWPINCGLFWRTWCAESVITAWRAWGDPLRRQQQRCPRRRSVRRRQSGRSVSRLE